MNKDYTELEVWQESRKLVNHIYGLTKSFPKEEQFGLTNQLRRASVSIPSNIAEGSSRKSNKDFARFLEITLGSVYEIETQLLIAFDLKFLNENELNILNTELNEIIKMMQMKRNYIPNSDLISDDDKKLRNQYNNIDGIEWPRKIVGKWYNIYGSKSYDVTLSKK